MNFWLYQIKVLYFLKHFNLIFHTDEDIGGAEEDRTPDPLRARQVLSQLSYDPLFLLRSFVLLFVISTLSLSHILTYAPSLFRTYASIKTKSLAKMLRWALFLARDLHSRKIIEPNLFLHLKTNCVGALGRLVPLY